MQARDDVSALHRPLALSRGKWHPVERKQIIRRRAAFVSLACLCALNLVNYALRWQTLRSKSGRKKEKGRQASILGRVPSAGLAVNQESLEETEAEH